MITEEIKLKHNNIRKIKGVWTITKYAQLLSQKSLKLTINNIDTHISEIKEKIEYNGHKPLMITIYTEALNQLEDIKNDLIEINKE